MLLSVPLEFRTIGNEVYFLKDRGGGGFLISLEILPFNIKMESFTVSGFR